jgi:hypothetical protein
MIISKNAFRVLIILSITLAFLFPLTVWAFNDYNFYASLPVELAGMAEQIDSRELGIFETIYNFIVLILLLVCYAGLFFFKSWARPLNLILIVTIPIIDMALGGPVILDSMQFGFNTYFDLLDGFILALTYFSNARTYFEN